jgi:proline dehydrogenase
MFSTNRAPAPVSFRCLINSASAFAEGSAIAWTRKADIDRAYLKLARRMLSPQAIEGGLYPAFGTHDHKMAGAILKMAQESGLSKQEFEFEMLYGVRPLLEQKLVDSGCRVRLYLPFGRDFWPYSVRRIGENPRQIKFICRSLAAGVR